MVRMMSKKVLALGILVGSIQGSFAQAPQQAPLELQPPRLLPSEGQPPPPPLPVIGATGALDVNGGYGPVQCAHAVTLEDRNGPALIGNPLLDGCNPNHLGWFASADLQMLDPHVSNRLIGTTTILGVTTTVQLPSADLNWSLSPRLELGYRLGQGAGELLLSYRFLTSSGTDTLPAFDLLGNPGALRSRFNMNVIDLDYASQENALLPRFNMRWHIGVRIASVYFDSQAASPLLEQHVTNYFYGAGPHAALELWRPIPETRAEIYGRIDGASVLGKTYQSFEQTLPGLGNDFNRQSQFLPSTMLNVQAGLAWSPADFWRLTVGYSYEHWWDIAVVGASRGEVWSQGIFFRGEWKF